MTAVAPEQPGKDDEQAEAAQVDRLRAAIGKLARGLRLSQTGTALTPSQVSVLFTIVRLGPIRLSEVVEIERLNPTMLSRITAELARLGLIRRRPDREDRRAAVLEATAAGRRMRERIHRSRSHALARYVERLPEAERRELWSALPVLEELAAGLAEQRR